MANRRHDPRLECGLIGIQSERDTLAAAEKVAERGHLVARKALEAQRRAAAREAQMGGDLEARVDRLRYALELAAPL
jgi:hypothetical protein